MPSLSPLMRSIASLDIGHARRVLEWSYATMRVADDFVDLTHRAMDVHTRRRNRGKTVNALRQWRQWVRQQVRDHRSPDGNHGWRAPQNPLWELRRMSRWAPTPQNPAIRSAVPLGKFPLDSCPLGRIPPLDHPPPDHLTLWGWHGLYLALRADALHLPLKNETLWRAYVYGAAVCPALVLISVLGETPAESHPELHAATSRLAETCYLSHILRDLDTDAAKGWHHVCLPENIAPMGRNPQSGTPRLGAPRAWLRGAIARQSQDIADTLDVFHRHLRPQHASRIRRIAAHYLPAVVP